MIRIVQSFNSIPFSFPVDLTAEFEPGMFAQLTTSGAGNQVVCGVSDGTAPIGIIDDMKSNAFSAVSIDEVIITKPIAGIISNGTLVTPMDVSANLLNPMISASSFTSNVDVELTARNGVVTFVAGTPLNFSLGNTGSFDSIRAVVSYSYQVPNVPGDDSTAGSHRVAVWFQKMLVQTDQFETNQRYPLNHPLFVNAEGKVTVRQITPEYPAIGMVTGPPSTIFGALELLLF